jgi:protein required for attachment to host cells
MRERYLQSENTPPLIAVAPFLPHVPRRGGADVQEKVQKKQPTTFVLVADASRARLFRRDVGTGRLDLVEELEHPLSRARNRDLMADKPGRAFTSGGMSSARSGIEYRTDPQQVEAEKFARELGDKLAASFDAHAFDALVIAAPPKFLGLLRHALATHTDHVGRAVTDWVEKDYTNLDERELGERMFAEAAE